MADTIHALVEIRIAVQGHIGLTPQSVSAFGGFKAQGKSVESRAAGYRRRAGGAGRGRVQHRAGVDPRQAGRADQPHARYPDHWHRRGRGCDGQVLVTHDLLGLFDRFTPKFVKQYAKLSGTMMARSRRTRRRAVPQLPRRGAQYSIDDEVWAAIEAELEVRRDRP